MNPGSPESQGAGERATMDAAGMTEGMPLGYAFQNKDKASSSLTEGEQIQELHRYYNGNGSDMSCEFNSSGDVVCTGSGSASALCSGSCSRRRNTNYYCYCYDYYDDDDY